MQYAPQNMEEQKLVKACLANNRLAQRQLYDRYKQAMYTLAYRITGNFDTANDVLQDAFLQVFRGLKGYKAQSTLGAWIKTIVVRTAYKTLKKEPYTESLEAHHTTDLINWGDQQLHVEYLEKAIQALPEGYRAVFVLIEVEGYAHKEVAQMLDISVGTSKSQLYHAKRRLRDWLKNWA